MRMRQSLSQLEELFSEEIELDRERRESLRLNSLKRSTSRKLERQHRQGAIRFLLLILAIISTSVIVTFVMFEALILVMG